MIAPENIYRTLDLDFQRAEQAFREINQFNLDSSLFQDFEAIKTNCCTLPAGQVLKGIPK